MFSNCVTRRHMVLCLALTCNTMGRRVMFSYCAARRCMFFVYCSYVQHGGGVLSPTAAQRCPPSRQPARVAAEPAAVATWRPGRV